MSLAEMPRPIAMENSEDLDDSPSPRMTLEEMLALPDADVERDLIEGRLVERPMTKRNRWHGRVETRLAHLLDEWLETLPELRGEIVSGETGFRIRRDPGWSRRSGPISTPA